jgi:hypothetical protein
MAVLFMFVLFLSVLFMFALFLSLLFMSVLFKFVLFLSLLIKSVLFMAAFSLTYSSAIIRGREDFCWFNIWRPGELERQSERAV